MTTTAAIFQLYERLGLEVFDCHIAYDTEAQKKKITYPENWKEAKCHLEPLRNAYALKTGIEYGITAIDIDDIELPHNKRLYEICEPFCNMIAKTPRGGFHLVFLYHSWLKTSSSEEYKLDIRNDGGNLMVQPTNYIKNDERVKYEWIKTPYGDELCEMPVAAYQLIVDLDCDIYCKVPDDFVHDTPIEGDTKANINVKELEKVLDGLNEKRSVDFQYWWKVGAILYNCGQSQSLFDKFSQRAGSRYNKKGVSDHWKTLKSNRNNKKLGLGTLWFWLKEDNFELFTQLRTLKKKEESQYGKCKKLFEKNHFYCRATNTIIEVDDNNSLSHFGIEHAQIAFNIPEYNFEFTDVNTGAVKQVPVVGKWLNDPTKLAYKELIFNPNQTVNNESFNTYRGLPIANVKRGDDVKIKRLIVMIEDVIMNLVNDEQLAFIYLRNWFAFKIQFPGRPIDVAVIISSLFHGIGKDTMGIVMNRIFGKFYSHISDAINNLFGQFNSELEDKLFVHLEEISGFDNRKNSNKLKSLITAKNMIVNHKGVKSYPKDCYFGFYGTSNEACPVLIEEDDRRFFHANAGSRNKAGTPNGIIFWNEFYKLLDDDSNVRGIYDYFMNINLDNFDPRNIYVTSSKKNLQINEVHNEKLFLIYLAENTDLIEDEISNDDLYNKYSNWCTVNKCNSSAKAWFMRKLTPYITLDWIKNKKSDSSKFKVISYDKIRNGTA